MEVRGPSSSDIWKTGKSSSYAVNVLCASQALGGLWRLSHSAFFPPLTVLALSASGLWSVKWRVIVMAGKRLPPGPSLAQGQHPIWHYFEATIRANDERGQRWPSGAVVNRRVAPIAWKRSVHRRWCITSARTIRGVRAAVQRLPALQGGRTRSIAGSKGANDSRPDSADEVCRRKKRDATQFAVWFSHKVRMDKHLSSVTQQLPHYLRPSSQLASISTHRESIHQRLRHDVRRQIQLEVGCVGQDTISVQTQAKTKQMGHLSVLRPLIAAWPEVIIPEHDGGLLRVWSHAKDAGVVGDCIP